METVLKFEMGGETIGAYPEFVNFGLGWHQLQVAMIATRHEGNPKMISLIQKDHSVDIAGGEEFITAYIPIACFNINTEDIPNKGVAKAIRKDTLTPVTNKLKDDFKKQIKDILGPKNSEARVDFASGMLMVLSALKQYDGPSVPYQISIMHTALREIGDQEGWQLGK